MLRSEDANKNALNTGALANTTMDDNIAFAHAILTIKHQQSLSDSLLHRIRMQCESIEDRKSGSSSINGRTSVGVGPSSSYGNTTNNKALSANPSSSNNGVTAPEKNASQSPGKKLFTAGGHEKQVVDHSYTDFSQTSDDMLYELMKNDVRQAEEQSTTSGGGSSSGGGAAATNQPAGRTKQSRSRVNAIGWKMLEDKPGMNVKEKLNVLYSNFRRNSGGVVQPFPEKLMELLANPKTQHIVSWMPHGRAFKVHNSKQFIEEVLPSFAGSKNIKYMSFNRQLNLWGFKRLTKGLDNGAYYHELFLRGRPMLAMRMRRHKVKGTGVKLGSNPEMEPNFYTMDLPRLPELWELEKTDEKGNVVASSDKPKDDNTINESVVVPVVAEQKEDASQELDETSTAAQSESTAGGDPENSSTTAVQKVETIQSDANEKKHLSAMKKRSFESSMINHKPSFEEVGAWEARTARQQQESSYSLPFPSPSLLSETEHQHHLIQNAPPQPALNHSYPSFHHPQQVAASDLAKQLQLEGLASREAMDRTSAAPPTSMNIGQHDRAKMLSSSASRLLPSRSSDATDVSNRAEVARNEILLEKQRQELALLSNMANMKRQEYELLTKLCHLGEDAISRGLVYRTTIAETSEQEHNATVEAAMLHDHLASIRALQRSEVERIPSDLLRQQGTSSLDAAAAAERINALSSYGAGLFQSAAAAGQLGESSLMRATEPTKATGTRLNPTTHGNTSANSHTTEAPGSPSMLHAAKRLSFLRCGGSHKNDSHHDAGPRLSFPFK